MAAPWDDCKVAFSIDDDEALWKADLEGRMTSKGLKLPRGWSLNMIDGAGARWMAVFRVAGVPSVEAGKKVAAELKRVKARL